MVFYDPPRRQPRKADDGKIMELADEILLKIHDNLSTLDSLKFRITCSAFIPAGNTAVARCMKKLYVSPSRSSLLAAIEICAHPVFASSIDTVAILGSEPQREELIERSSTTGRLDRSFGDWLLTWPTTFPITSKIVGNKVTRSLTDGFCDVYKPLLDALLTLPKLTALTFASAVSRTNPGFNQVKQSSLDSFPKRHLNKPSAHHERWSDGYAMFAMLSAMGDKIEDFGLCDNIAESYVDLIVAEVDFKVNLVEDNISKVDEAETLTTINRLWGNYFGRPTGTYFMPKTTFPVSRNSAIAGIRRHAWEDGPLEIRFMQQNGVEGRVKLWRGHSNAD